MRRTDQHQPRDVGDLPDHAPAPELQDRAPQPAGESVGLHPRRVRWHGQDHVVVRWRHRLPWLAPSVRSEEHTSELQSLMRISYAVFCLKKKKQKKIK